MWKRSYSKIATGVKREDIWAVWIDVNNWPAWQHDLEYCTLDGKFEVGNHFFLKPKGVSQVKIIITEVIDGCSFTDCTQFFGAKMYDTHVMHETSDGLMIAHTVVVTGPLRWLWVKLVAQNLADTVPQQMEALIAYVKRRYE